MTGTNSEKVSFFLLTKLIIPKNLIHAVFIYEMDSKLMWYENFN